MEFNIGLLFGMAIFLTTVTCGYALLRLWLSIVTKPHFPEDPLHVKRMAQHKTDALVFIHRGLVLALFTGMVVFILIVTWTGFYRSSPLVDDYELDTTDAGKIQYEPAPDKSSAITTESHQDQDQSMERLDTFRKTLKENQHETTDPVEHDPAHDDRLR